MGDPDSPEQRLARWAERDAVVGLGAELEQARHRLAQRESEVRDLRARCEQLGNRITQLELERHALQHQVAASRRVPVTRRAYGATRRLAGRLLRG